MFATDYAEFLLKCCAGSQELERLAEGYILFPRCVDEYGYCEVISICISV